VIPKVVIGMGKKRKPKLRESVPDVGNTKDVTPQSTKYEPGMGDQLEGGTVEQSALKNDICRLQSLSNSVAAQLQRAMARLKVSETRAAYNSALAELAWAENVMSKSVRAELGGSDSDCWSVRTDATDVRSTSGESTDDVLSVDRFNAQKLRDNGESTADGFMSVGTCMIVPSVGKSKSVRAELGGNDNDGLSVRTDATDVRSTSGESTSGESTSGVSKDDDLSVRGDTSVSDGSGRSRPPDDGDDMRGQALEPATVGERLLINARSSTAKLDEFNAQNLGQVGVHLEPAQGECVGPKQAPRQLGLEARAWEPTQVPQRDVDDFNAQNIGVAYGGAKGMCYVNRFTARRLRVDRGDGCTYGRPVCGVDVFGSPGTGGESVDGDSSIIDEFNTQQLTNQGWCERDGECVHEGSSVSGGGPCEGGTSDNGIGAVNGADNEVQHVSVGSSGALCEQEHRGAQEVTKDALSARNHLEVHGGVSVCGGTKGRPVCGVGIFIGSTDNGEASVDGDSSTTDKFNMRQLSNQSERDGACVFEGSSLNGGGTCEGGTSDHDIGALNGGDNEVQHVNVGSSSDFCEQEHFGAHEVTKDGLSACNNLKVHERVSVCGGTEGIPVCGVGIVNGSTDTGEASVDGDSSITDKFNTRQLTNQGWSERDGACVHGGSSVSGGGTCEGGTCDNDIGALNGGDDEVQHLNVGSSSEVCEQEHFGAQKVTKDGLSARENLKVHEGVSVCSGMKGRPVCGVGISHGSPGHGEASADGDLGTIDNFNAQQMTKHGWSERESFKQECQKWLTEKFDQAGPSRRGGVSVRDGALAYDMRSVMATASSLGFQYARSLRHERQFNAQSLNKNGLRGGGGCETVAAGGGGSGGVESTVMSRARQIAARALGESDDAPSNNASSLSKPPRHPDQLDSQGVNSSGYP